MELPFFRISLKKKSLFGGDWLIRVIRKVGIYSQRNTVELGKGGFSLTFRLVLCYNGHRLSSPLQGSGGLLVRCSAEVDAIHLEEEARELWYFIRQIILREEKCFSTEKLRLCHLPQNPSRPTKAFECYRGSFRLLTTFSQQRHDILSCGVYSMSDWVETWSVHVYENFSVCI